MRRAGLLVIAALAGACATARPAPPSATPTLANGVEGQALIGPMCPVIQADTPCPDQPYAATLTVLNQAGQVVATAQADAQGRFRLALPPGAYTLRPESPPGLPLPRAEPLSFTVTTGYWTTLTILYDSGIR